MLFQPQKNGARYAILFACRYIAYLFTCRQGFSSPPAPTSLRSRQCTKGDEVFEYVNQKRRSRATLGSSHSWLLNIDMWDSTGESPDITYKAEVQEVSVQVDTYGGAGGETPTLEFTLNYVGDPIPGTVKITSGKPTFTADGVGV